MQNVAIRGAAGQDVSIDETRTLFRPAVEWLVEYMRASRLKFCPFLLKADGHHDDGPAITLALHCELFEELGCTIVGHSVWFEHGPSAQNPAVMVEKTCWSVLVKAPRIVS